MLKIETNKTYQLNVLFLQSLSAHMFFKKTDAIVTVSSAVMIQIIVSPYNNYLFKKGRNCIFFYISETLSVN